MSELETGRQWKVIGTKLSLNECQESSVESKFRFSKAHGFCDIRGDEDGQKLTGPLLLCNPSLYLNLSWTFSLGD